MARRYARDNRGRFASSGSGATARGGRLKTASGKKRATQTMKASAAPTGTVGKPKGLKPGAIKPKAAAKPAAARLRRTGQTMKIAKKKPPTPTKEDKSIEKVKSLKAATPAFGTGKSTASFIPDSALTPKRRAALGLSAFASSSESQRWRVSRQTMGSQSGVLIQERSGYRASLPKTRQGVIAKPAAAKPAAKAASNPAAANARKPAVAASKPATASKLGFAQSDFARRSQRTALIRNPEIRARAQRLYGRVMDTGQTPRQLRSMFKKAGKPKAKAATAETRRRQREHRDMLAASRSLFR